MDVWPRGAPLPARPVADAPRPAGEALARGWLIALIAGVPLTQAARIPVAELAADAPALGDAIVAALRDDEALARLAPEGDLAPLAAQTAHMAGAGDPAATAAAVDLLRTVTWGVLRTALGVDPDPRLVSDLAERLARVAAVVTAACLAGPPAPAAADTPAPVADPPFLVHDARAAACDPWLRPIDFALARHGRTGEPFTVLLVDLDDIDRLLAVQDDGLVPDGAAVGASATAVADVSQVLEQAERLLRAEIRGEDALVRERAGRYWIVASGFDEAAGRALAGRVASAVHDGTVLHGAPLAVSLGMAVGPHDGATADALVARADEGAFRARAAGVPLA